MVNVRLPDGVANPVRQGPKKCCGRGCKPRPANYKPRPAGSKKMLRTGLQTPSGKLQTPSDKILGLIKSEKLKAGRTFYFPLSFLFFTRLNFLHNLFRELGRHFIIMGKLNEKHAAAPCH